MGKCNSTYAKMLRNELNIDRLTVHFTYYRIKYHPFEISVNGVEPSLVWIKNQRSPVNEAEPPEPLTRACHPKLQRRMVPSQGFVMYCKLLFLITLNKFFLHTDSTHFAETPLFCINPHGSN